MKFTRYLALIAFTCCFLSVANAQNDNDYKKRAAEVRQEIWGWNIPAFKNRTVPEAFRNESGIILARHHEIKAASRNNEGTAHKNVYYSNTVRELVKINDKATLEEYSEFGFQKFKKLNSVFSKKANSITILGVRIYKADGSIKEVNADDAVLIKDEKNDKQGKLAITDLQVGDMIDYFIREEEEKDYSHPIDPELFLFGDDKPILHYSIHCEFGKKYALEYRAMNGAPEFKVKKDSQEDNILDAEMENIPSLPVSLWMSAYRQIPILRLNVIVGYKGMFAGAINSRNPGEVYRNQSTDEIIDDIRVEMQTSVTGMYYKGVPLYYKEVKSLLKQYNKKNDDIPKDSLPYYVYYALRYLTFYRVGPKDPIIVGRDRNYQTPNNHNFLFLLNLILREFDIPCDIVLATSLYGPDSKQVMSRNDFEFMLKTQEGKPVFMSAEGVFTNCNYISSEYEGQRVPVIYIKSIRMMTGRLITENSVVDLPKTKALQNKHSEILKVSFGNDLQQMNIDRKTVLTGHMRSGEQKSLLLFEDYYDEERKALGVKESFMEEFADSRRNRSLSDEYKAAFAKAREESRQQFVNEIKDQFDNEPKDLKLFRVDNMGLRHTNPDFIYTTQFAIDGWIKKAGNNYIFEIGKLIGSQLELKPDQRKRKVDVYMPFPRTYEYTIEVDIPAGYKVEGLDKLVQNKSNESGSFVATAQQTGNTIHIKVSKIYNNTIEPVSRWPKLVEIMDAANDYLGQKILLKKGA
jgi:hypothetical protein